jgi:hypothetical protein
MPTNRTNTATTEEEVAEEATPTPEEMAEVFTTPPAVEDKVAVTNRSMQNEFWTPERKARHRELFTLTGDWAEATRQLWAEAKANKEFDARARWTELRPLADR